MLLPDFTEKFKRLALLCAIPKTPDETVVEFWAKLRWDLEADVDYACEQIANNGDKITLANFRRYISELKNRRPGGMTKKLVEPAEEVVENCNHKCKECCLAENQSCKETTLALLCYIKQIVSKKMTVQEAERQFQSDFPRMKIVIGN